MSRARAIAAAIDKILASLPGCSAIAYRPRDSEPGYVLHLETANEADAASLAALFGIEHMGETHTASSAWASGSTVEGDLFVLVNGPVRSVR